MFSNDTVRPLLHLRISGRVENIYTLTPKSVRLSGIVGEPLRKTVMIEPNPKYLFRIKNAVARSGKDIRFRLEDSRDATGVKYQLTVENLKKEKGRYFDTITLSTDSKLRPSISINVRGRIVNSRKETL